MGMTQDSQVVYFGKTPSRGDFVKSSNDLALTALFDRWLSHGMALLSEASDWKLRYDATPPMHFSILGPRNHVALAGYLVASADGSERRFPFLSAAKIDVNPVEGFVAYAPLMFAQLWRDLENGTHAVLNAAEPGEALSQLAQQDVNVDSLAVAKGHYQQFLKVCTLDNLKKMLARSNHEVDLPRLILALGLLLTPVMQAGAPRLEKNLLLPLPDDPIYRNMTACLWLDCISRFLQRSDFELAIFQTIESKPHLVLSFMGASGRTLQAMFDPLEAAKQNISIDDAQWVDAQLGTEPDVRKLYAYLQQPTISLEVIVKAFGAAFVEKQS